MGFLKHVTGLFSFVAAIAANIHADTNYPLPLEGAIEAGILNSDSFLSGSLESEFWDFVSEVNPVACIEREGTIFIFVLQHKNENLAIARYVGTHLFDLRDQKQGEEYVKLYRYIRRLDAFLFDVHTGALFETNDVECFWNLPKGAAYRARKGAELEIFNQGAQPDRIWVEDVSN